MRLSILLHNYKRKENLMEALLTQILNEVKDTNLRLSKVEQNQLHLETRFDALEQRQLALETRFDALEQRQLALETRFDALEQKQTSMDKKLDMIYEQTANLVEFRTEVNIKLDHLTNRVDTVDPITKENLYDLTKLKLAK